MGEEGYSKALLCPDARENLGFSVQTIVASLQKTLFKGFLLAKLKLACNFYTLLTTYESGSISDSVVNDHLRYGKVLIPYESGSVSD